MVSHRRSSWRLDDSVVCLHDAGNGSRGQPAFGKAMADPSKERIGPLQYCVLRHAISNLVQRCDEQGVSDRLSGGTKRLGTHRIAGGSWQLWFGSHVAIQQDSVGDECR